jgi:hypothetical protein
MDLLELANIQIAIDRRGRHVSMPRLLKDNSGDWTGEPRHIATA